MAAGLRYLGLGARLANQQCWNSDYWQQGLATLVVDICVVDIIVVEIIVMEILVLEIYVVGSWT